MSRCELGVITVMRIALRVSRGSTENQLQEYDKIDGDVMNNYRKKETGLKFG